MRLDDIHEFISSLSQCVPPVRAMLRKRYTLYISFLMLPCNWHFGNLSFVAIEKENDWKTYLRMIIIN